MVELGPEKITEIQSGTAGGAGLSHRSRARPKDRGSRTILGVVRDGQACAAPYPDNPEPVGCWIQDREDPFRHGLEPRVMAAVAHGRKRSGVLAQVPLWASGSSRGLGGRCRNGIPKGTLGGPALGLGPLTREPPAAPEASPHLTTLEFIGFPACPSAPEWLKPPRRPPTLLEPGPRPQTPALSRAPPR